ncbi:MAG: hypothetical protein OQK95_03815 [Gammaproteobacteria bacterium]|nr:hypothetical protein [Gammaproteobacteria bacterium]
MAGKEIVFKQRNALGLDILVKLIDGRELQVSNIGKKTNQTYSVDILSLQDKSKKIFSIAWKWLAASMSFLLVMLLLFKFLPTYLTEHKNLYLGVILLVGLLGSIYSFIQFWKNTSQKQVFYSRKAHVPIIILYAGKPSKKAFSLFIDSIEKRIKKFRNHMDIDDEKQLTGEMKMLRRLSDDGVISKKAYEKAKAKLFTGFDSSLVKR